MTRTRSLTLTFAATSLFALDAGAGPPSAPLQLFPTWSDVVVRDLATQSGGSASFAIAGRVSGTLSVSQEGVEGQGGITSASAVVGSGINYPSDPNTSVSYYDPAPQGSVWLVNRINNTDADQAFRADRGVQYTLTFDRPVENPRFHFLNLDNGSVSFDQGTVTRLAGNTEFEVSGLRVNNPETSDHSLNPGCEANDGTNPSGACGTVEVTGTVSAVTFRIYDHYDVDAGSSGDEWSFTWSVAALAPAAPTALQVTPGYESLQVAFTAGENGGDAITNYEYTLDDGTTWTAFAPDATTSPLRVVGLAPGVLHTLKLRAVNAVGPGEASAAVSSYTRGPVLVETDTVPAGSTCTEGGLQIDVGSDNNANGLLDDGEIDATQTRVVCHGVDGNAGSDGTDGVDGVDGADALRMLVTSVDADVAVCEEGGKTVSHGLDDGLDSAGSPAGSAGDDTLDVGEVDGSFTICNGVTGIAGDPGADGLVSLLETRDASVTDCPGGGTTVSVGIDDDGDGQLASEEVDEVHHVCDGLPGLDGADGAAGDAGADGVITLTSVTELPVGDRHCYWGGQRVAVGGDDNGDGVLSPDEEDGVAHVCNGARGVDGTSGDTGEIGVPGKDGSAGAPGSAGQRGTGALTEIVPLADDSDACAFGGVQVFVGVDDNRDGALSDAEIDDRATLCNGKPGVVDTDEDGKDDRVSLSGGASCAAGGAPGTLGFLLLGFWRRRRRA